jgi:hypothetical protein
MGYPVSRIEEFLATRLLVDSDPPAVALGDAVRAHPGAAAGDVLFAAAAVASGLQGIPLFEHDDHGAVVDGLLKALAALVLDVYGTEQIVGPGATCLEVVTFWQITEEQFFSNPAKAA